MGGHHHCGGDAGEGQGVLEQGEEAVAGEPVYEPPPYRHPHDLEQRVGDDHRAHAIGVEPQHQGYLQQAEGQRRPHVDVAAPVADHHVGHQCRQGHHGAAETEYLHEMGTVEPFLADGDDDELLAYQRQAEEQGKGDEGGET